MLNKYFCKKKYLTFKAPGASMYCFMENDIPGSMNETGSDFEAVSSGYISVCPVPIQPRSCPENNRKNSYIYIHAPYKDL